MRSRAVPCRPHVGPSWRHTETVTTVPALLRPRPSAAEIRTALVEHAPGSVPEFERDFRAALTQAAASFDTTVIDDVLERWQRIAAARSVKLSQAEHEQLHRARDGDFDGLWEQTEQGSFRRVG